MRAARIAALVRQAAGRITVMPGSGVTPGNAAMLKGLGIREIHASCSVSTPVSGRAVEMGFAPSLRRQTDADAVRATEDPFQPLAPGVAALTERVRAQFDPQGIFNPGRMYGGA